MDDFGIAKLCAAIYDPTYSNWDIVFDGTKFGGIYAAIKDNIIIFRGSITPEDWYRDLKAFPQIPTDHIILGQIHSGFYEGIDDFFVQASLHLSDDPIIAGHSLGAAHAWLFAARYIIQGGRTKRIVTFGSPRPGCRQLQSILKPYDKASYKNRQDPVTDVPLWLPEFPVVDMYDFTMFNVSPAKDDLSILADHHIGHYVSGFDQG